MKVVILAGGFGTRLAEYTDLIPKPMVTVGGRPILWHIMQHYARFGHKDFVLALGYKAEVVKEYFLNYRTLSSDFHLDLGSGAVTPLSSAAPDWRITLVDTGANSMTGGRVKRLEKFVAGETFMLTYGDGVSDVDIGALVAFHRAHGKIATLTTVRPVSRFGVVHLDRAGHVEGFHEKPVGDGWINAGFFVFDRRVFDYLDGDACVLEQAPMRRLAEDGQLMAFRHDGFFFAMDTYREYQQLNQMWERGEAPWRVWRE